MTPDVLDKPTKSHRGENFPVGSLLIAPRHRSVILAYYRFARGADDVADNVSLTPDAKLARLDQFEAMLTGRSDAILKRSDFKCGLESAEPVVHANPHLIEARSLERSGGRVKIFDLRAPIRRKPILNASANCPADPRIGSRTGKERPPHRTPARRRR